MSRCKSWLTLWFLLGQQCLSGANGSEDKNTLQVPAFTLEELRAGTRSKEMLSALRTTGLLSIRTESSESLFSIQNQEHFRHRSLAMNGLCECLHDAKWTGGVDGVDSVILDDGTTGRTTIATATVGNSPLPFSSQGELETACGQDTLQSMEALRDHVALVSSTFVQALDNLNTQASAYVLDTKHKRSPSGVMLRDTLGRKYQKLEEVIQSANHLEHFHYYHKEATSSFESNEDEGSRVLDWHTDAGLFLAFMPAWDCVDARSEPGDKFWVQLPDGQEVPTRFEEGTIAIMMGAGAEHWLHTPLGLRATRHAVQMRGGDARAWYGMMHLVPERAIIQEEPQRTFSDMKENMRLSGENRRTYGNHGDSSAVAIGCGPANEPMPLSFDDYQGGELDGFTMSSRRRLQHVQDARACNNVTNFFCWVQCLEIPNYQQSESYVNEGYSLYCLDPGTLARTGNRVSKAIEPCEGKTHNSDCQGVWYPTAPGTEGYPVEYNVTISFEEEFCYGGTSMYMDGFHWIHPTTCVIYLFPQWVLSSEGQLVAACFGTILFGILLEYVISCRRNTVSQLPVGMQRLGASAGFYGVQLTIGYLVMLIVMTYSLPLFLCCILGLVGGHILFNAKDALVKKTSKAQLEKQSALNKTGSVRKSSSVGLTDSDLFFGQMTNNKNVSKVDDSDVDTRPTDSEHAEIEDGRCNCNPMGMIEEELDDEGSSCGVPEGITPCCQNEL